MMRRFFKNQKGQTAVEYILMIVVAVAFGLTFMKKMDEYVIKNPNGMIGKPLNSFKKSLQADSSGRYSRFPLRH